MRSRGRESVPGLVRRSGGPRALDRARAARPNAHHRPARARQRGPAALLRRDGHALPAPHRRADGGRARLDGVRDPDLGKSWLESLEHQRRLSPRTLENYRRALEVLLKLKDKTSLRDLEAQHVRHFVARLHAAGLSGRTLALMLSAWRGLYRWLARRHGYVANPAQGVRPPKSPRSLPK